MGWILPGLHKFKEELHTDSIEFRDIHCDHPLDQGPRVRVIRCAYVDHSLENKHLIALLLVHNQVFTCKNCNIVLLVRNLHTNDLLWLSFNIFEKGHLNKAFWHFLKGINIIEVYLINLADKESIHAANIEATAAIQILWHDVELEVVHELPAVNIE